MTILVVDGAAKVYLREGMVKLLDREGNSDEEPLADLELLVVIGKRVLLTSALALELAHIGTPLVLIDPRRGTTAILYNPVQVGSIEARAAQYRCIENENCRLKYAREMIKSKLAGLRNMIRYELKYHPEYRSEDTQYKLSLIDAAKSEADTATTIDELRTIEAEGSRNAWKIIARMIPDKYQFPGRKPRNGDPINSAIDLAYAILYAMATKALTAAGLDPYAGLMHTQKRNKPSLAYDFTEIYKPLAIHAVIQASRQRTIKTYRGSGYLTPKSLEAIIKQLYHRLHVLTEKTYKRKNIWTHILQEARNLQQALTRNTTYKPYTYSP